MCSIVFFLIFKNKIYNRPTYSDLYTRIILNNVLEFTLDIVENFFFRTSSCEFIYTIRIACATGKSILENLMKASWNSILVDAREIAS